MNRDDPRVSLKDYPTAYAAGHVFFWGCRIDLRYRPFIPRPETEYWVEKAVGAAFVTLKVTNAHFLDIFCGSGCVGIALLAHIPHAHVTFADISEKSIKQTKFNLKINKIPTNRYKVIKSNIFEKISNKFDYIFANPPYVGTEDEFGPEILHEPHKALFAGQDGMDVVAKFLKHAPNYLNINGTIFMEFGENQKGKISKLLQKSNGKYQFHKDQYGKWRWLEIRYKQACGSLNTPSPFQ